MKLLGRSFVLAACATWLVLAGGAAAECVYAPDLVPYQTATAADFAMGPTRSDRLGRVVAPITVNGQGPFRFIVDTGANRSVLSQDLADRLGLTPSGTGQVHSVHGVTAAPLVDVVSLQYGGLALNAAQLPTLGGAVLAGEHGLLGVDGMQGRRLRLDFERNCIEIVPSRDARRLHGWTMIRGQLRFGHLVVVHGYVGGIRVNMFLDSGSDSSLANLALREALNARLRSNRGRIESVISSTVGESVVLNDSIRIRSMRMGDLEVENITAYVGDFHIFQLWNLADEPTLLLGMDVLSQTRGLAIDYQRGTVYLRLREPVETGTRLRH